MLSVEQATMIVEKALPNGQIQAVVEYNDLYLFQVFTDRPFEEEFDPFYSVDKNTGAFSDFSIITDGNISEILPLFEQEKRRGNRPRGG